MPIPITAPPAAARPLPGSAAKLTHINYAFGNVTGGKCAMGDAYAATDRAYTAAESVDGDRWTTVGTARLRGLPSTVEVGLFATSPQHSEELHAGLMSGF